jgi:EmrB/QacA subfamily drug resistance transporter
MSVTRTTARPVPFDAELRTLAFVVAAGAMMTFLDSTIVNVAVTSLARGFHTSLSTIQWVLTGYGLSLSMIIPVTGWAVDRLGAKTAWIASLAVFIGGSVLCGAAWNIGALIVFRVIQGIGGGMILPIGQIMLARKAGPDRMARAMAVAAIPAMLGPVLGPVLGGLIVDDLSWRWMFFVNVPLCAIALVMAVKLLPGDACEHVRTRIDSRGLVLLAPGLTLVMYGLSQVGPDLIRSGIWVAAGAVFVAAYVLHARRIEIPLVSVRVFTRRAFGVSSVAMFVYLVAVYGFMVVLPVYFQVLRGESALDSGLLLIPLAVGGGLSMAVSGRLADQVAPRWIIVGGMVLVVAGAITFTRLGTEAGLPVVIGVLFVVSLGHGAILPAAMGSAYQGMPKPEIPPATATFNVIFRVSSSFGTALLAVILQDAISDRIPGANSLAAAARLHGESARSVLNNAFGQSFWWVAALAAVAALPAFFIPARKGAASMSSLLSPGVDSAAEPRSAVAAD